MNLTFKGFLRSYCRELAGAPTDNLRKLCAAANTDAPRAAEVLFLFALEQGKLARLLALCPGTWMEEDYLTLSERAAAFEGNAEAFLREEELPARYKKILDAYHAKKNSAAPGRRMSLLMREKTLQALTEKGVSVYRLCKDLNLNKGNAYAYLSKGDASKVSKATAARMMEYALSLP